MEIGPNSVFYSSPLHSSCEASVLVVFSGLPFALAGTKKIEKQYLIPTEFVFKIIFIRFKLVLD